MLCKLRPRSGAGVKTLLFLSNVAVSVLLVVPVLPGMIPLTQFAELAQLLSAAVEDQVGAAVTTRSISVPPGLENEYWKPEMSVPVLKTVGVKLVVLDSVMSL